MHTPIECLIIGSVPIMFHNSQLADPANVYAMAIKKEGKGSTPEKAKRLYDLSWEACLYLDHEQRVIVPGENIEAALIEASGAFKLKKDFKAGVFCDGAYRLDYDGPTDLEKLKADSRFRDLRSVKTKRGDRIMFCRPKFVEWSLRFTFLVDTDIVSSEKAIDMLERAGKYIAVGCYRPKYGRFMVSEAKAIGQPGKGKKLA